MNERFLEAKKILFLGYEYYNYHHEIKNALVSAGASVDFFPVFDYGFKYSFLRRVSRRAFARHNRNHREFILKNTENRSYDFVFVISGYLYSPSFFGQLRQRNPSAVFINYHWDSNRKTEFGTKQLDCIPFFDYAFSFDKRDCEKNDNLFYQPLFYSRPPIKKEDPKYDLAFVGSVTQYRRYQAVKRLEEYCKNNDLKFRYYLRVYVRDYIKFLLKGRVLRGIGFRAWSAGRVERFYNHSRAVVDLPNQIQSGLTMRVIEVLGSGLKLVTTNREVLSEELFDPKNVMIIDIENPIINKDFLLNGGNSSRMDSYHISSWLKTLFFSRPSK